MDMQTGWNENRALLRGTAAAEPVLSHETHGVVYETFPLAVRRLSGSEDRVNVLVPRALLEQRPVTAGMELEVEALLRESQLAREAVQLKQTLELGKHVRREIEKEQMKKDTPEGMLS